MNRATLEVALLPVTQGVMKLAIVTITIISLVSLLAFGKLVFALALFLATLILSRGNIDWESLPSLEEPYSMPRYFMLITMVIFLIFFEAKLLQ